MEVRVDEGKGDKFMRKGMSSKGMSYEVTDEEDRNCGMNSSGMKSWV